MKNKNYCDFSEETKQKISKEFLRIYKDSSLTEINSAFETINPVVKYNNLTDEYEIWEANKSRFESIIYKK